MTYYGSSCENCKKWQRIDGSATQGTCHEPKQPNKEQPNHSFCCGWELNESKQMDESKQMNESKLEIFMAKMKVAASNGASEPNGASKPEDMTDDGRNPMMRRWLYGLTMLLEDYDRKIIRLSLYPDMIPDELRAAYDDVLADSLSRMSLTKAGVER